MIEFSLGIWIGGILADWTLAASVMLHHGIRPQAARLALSAFWPLTGAFCIVHGVCKPRPAPEPTRHG